MKARRNESGLPDSQPHHHDAEGHPPEDPDGNNGFQAHAPRGFFCMTLGNVFLHDAKSSEAGSVVDEPGYVSMPDQNGPSKGYALFSWTSGTLAATP